MIAVAAHGQETIQWLQILARYGADFNQKTTRGGRTPIYSAIAATSLDNIRFLLENGARTDAQTDNGDFVLTYAARNWRYSGVYLLLEAGADYEVSGPEAFGNPTLVSYLSSSAENAGFDHSSEEWTRWRPRVIEFLLERNVELPQAVLESVSR